MSIRALFLIALLLCGLFGASCGKKEEIAVPVDFERAMGSGSVDWEALVSHAGNKERIEKLKSAYDRRVESSSIDIKIPKIIHQIWLGPKPVPSYFWEYKKGWERRHPGWEYRFWTDKDVVAFDFDLKDLYQRSTNWGEKSDILRAEILDRFGGLYVDTDIENIKSFDELHLKHDFYAGLEPPHQGDISQSAPHVVISDALIACRPNHPIIKTWKLLIREIWDDIEQRLPDSPKRVLLRTFYPFGEAVMLHLDDAEFANIVYPATYFYPLTFSRVSKGRIKKLNFFKRQVKNIVTLFKQDNTPFVELQPETMAVHYWGNSWVKSNEERLREMHRHIISFEERMQNDVNQLQDEVTYLRKQVESLKEVR
jgi:mannosyltransferase OCH1-like enzyme